MEEVIKPQWRDLCNCCCKPVPEGAVRIGAKVYCDEEHALVDRRYLNLCAKARRKALKYPRHEIDLGLAMFYLSAKLGQFKSQELVTAV